MSQKKRIQNVLKIFVVLLTSGLLYAMFFQATGMGIPCIFHILTGFKCPGCGLTHMGVALLHLDIAAAWESNPVILCMLPPGFVLALYTISVYITKGKWPDSRWYNCLIILMIAALLIFGVVRNFPSK